MAHKEKEIQSLQERVIELERQLAEAQAAIQALISSHGDIHQTAAAPQSEPQGQLEFDLENLMIGEAGIRRVWSVMPYPLMIRRDDGHVVMINAAWTKISGYTLEDIPTIEEWTNKAYGEGAPQRKSEMLKEGFSQMDIKQWGEDEITTRSGEKRIWDFSTAPLGVDQKGRRLTMDMAVDITERKKSEEELRAARDEATWLARFPGENPNPVMRVSDQGIVLYCNPPAASLRGWRCAIHTPLASPLLDLLELAIEQDRVVEQDVSLGDKFYSVSVIPLLKQGYLNLYGRDVTERKLTEKALAESERRQREITRLLELDQARLAAIVRHLPVGVWIVDEQSRLMGSNPEAERIWAGEVPVDGPADYQKYVSRHTGSGELLKPEEFPIAVALRTGESVPPMETNIRRFDGSEGTVLVSAVPIKDGLGQLIGVVAVNVDITERKRVERALLENEQRLKRAQEIAHLGNWELDLINNRLTWSDEVYRIFGLQPQQFGATYEAFLEVVHPDDRAAVDDAYSASIREGRDQYEIEHRVIRQLSGEVRIVHEKCEHFRDQDGQIIRSVGMVHDVTERKQVEEALRASEERFHSLADSMPQLVWTALPDGTVDYYNQRYQEYREIKQGEGATWEWAAVLHPDDLQPTLDAWQHALQTGDIYQIEHRVRTADGSYRWHLSRGIPVRDESGQIIRWFGTATDIHDLKLAEEQLRVYAERLERSNRELEQFAFMASHDLQEPLRKIEMFGDLLLERATYLNDRERNYVDRMRNASGRMRDMVEGLLRLSRITTQGKSFTPVDLSHVTSAVLQDLEDQIRRTSGKVDVEPLPIVEGDTLQLRQLMQNLIGNALKYYQPGTSPRINISAKQLSGKVQIFVEDQGIGFAQEDADRIFQPFQRLVGRSQYEGSGMGLAICRRIVQRHGGEIAAFSKPGHGTTVTVTLPSPYSGSVANELEKDAGNEESSTTPGR